MANSVENLYFALPNGLAVERLMHRHRFDVHRFDVFGINLVQLPDYHL
jgi:hypothetical protein